MVTRLRPAPADPGENLELIDRHISELTVALAGAVAERAAVAEVARDRIHASARVAYTISEVAAVVGVHRQTVLNWTRLDDEPLRVVAIDGGVLRVRAAELDRFLIYHERTRP